MFTGIIRNQAEVVRLRNGELSVRLLFDINEALKKGESIAVSGVCLTLKNSDNEIATPRSSGARNDRGSKRRETNDKGSMKMPAFDFDVSETTIEKTNFRFLKPGHIVNIEFPLRAQDFISGHIVSGHVEGTVSVESIVQKGGFHEIGLKYKDEISARIFDEASVALDGISLTVGSVDKASRIFFISVIPETFANTNLKYRKTGDLLNIETDYLLKGKIEKKNPESKISYEFLAEKGFL